MANPWKQWHEAEFNGLMLYTLGDLVEALSIMKVIHPRMKLPFDDDVELMKVVAVRTLEITEGGE